MASTPTLSPRFLLKESDSPREISPNFKSAPRYLQQERYHSDSSVSLSIGKFAPQQETEEPITWRNFVLWTPMLSSLFKSASKFQALLATQEIILCIKCDGWECVTATLNVYQTTAKNSKAEKAWQSLLRELVASPPCVPLMRNFITTHHAEPRLFFQTLFPPKHQLSLKSLARIIPLHTCADLEDCTIDTMFRAEALSSILLSECSESLMQKPLETLKRALQDYLKYHTPSENNSDQFLCDFFNFGFTELYSLQFDPAWCSILIERRNLISQKLTADKIENPFSQSRILLGECLFVRIINPFLIDLSHTPSTQTCLIQFSKLILSLSNEILPRNPAFQAVYHRWRGPHNHFMDHNFPLNEDET